MTEREIFEIVLQASVVITGMLGQYFVAKRNIAGFKIWLVSNLLLITLNLTQGLYLLSLLYVFYAWMCIYSIREWRKPQSDEKNDS